ALADTVGGVTVTPLSDPAGDGAGVLAPGAAETATGTYTLTQADIDAGSKFNRATATGTAPSGSKVSDDDTATVSLAQAPAINLVKSGTYQDSNHDGVVDVGDSISYTFTVSNT